MKKAVLYSIGVCLFSWAAYALVMVLCKGELSPIAMTAVKSVYMLFPALTALVFQAAGRDFSSNRTFLNFRFSWTWLWAIAVVIAAVALCIPICAMIPGVHLRFGAEQLISMNGLEGEQAEMLRSQIGAIPPYAVILGNVFSGIFAGCTINALFAFCEEYGWRNYLVGALKGQKFWKAALFIGLVWGIWHAPLILEGHNYPQHPVAGVPMMCVFCILMGVLELYFTLKTRSVFVAAMMHGTINALAGMVLFLVEGGSDLTIGLTGASGFIALGIIILLTYLYDCRHERIMQSEL